MPIWLSVGLDTRVCLSGGPESFVHPWENAFADQPPDHPVANMTWFDAAAFCRWLGETEGRTYRLPTEAEWEYACRAGTHSQFWCGNALWMYRPMGNLSDWGLRRGDAVHMEWVSPWDDGYRQLAPVGSYPPNPFGVYDMHGNIREWVADWYQEDYYNELDDQHRQTGLVPEDPQGPAKGHQRTIRGGGYASNASYTRSARRIYRAPGSRNVRNGFRVVCEVGKEQEETSDRQVKR